MNLIWQQPSQAPRGLYLYGGVGTGKCLDGRQVEAQPLDKMSGVYQVICGQTTQDWGINFEAQSIIPKSVQNDVKLQKEIPLY